MKPAYRLFVRNIFALILILALFVAALPFPVFALDFFEDFDAAGQPPSYGGGYWYFLNTINPAQDTWNEFIPGDGIAYIKVTSASHDDDKNYQTICFGEVGPGHMLEMRAKNLPCPGYTGFIFTYQEASTFDEIDIEVTASDDELASHAIDPPDGWSDVRLNSWGNSVPAPPYDPFSGITKALVDENGSKVSHRDGEWHTYTIDWINDGGLEGGRNGRVRFYIDGAFQHEITWPVPDSYSEVLLGYRDLTWAGPDNPIGWSGTHTLELDWLAVHPVDYDSPVAAPDTHVLDSDTTLTIIAPGILTNDSGTGLGANLVSDVEHGTLLLNTNGSFSYTPDPGFVGKDHFVYFADDGTSNGRSNTARVLLRVGQPPEWQKVDDMHASVSYSAGWETYVGSGGYQNTEHYSETTGATATFNFTGTQARYYGFKRSDLGNVNIYVDGIYVTTLDLYSSTFLVDYLLFETDVLPSGPHTLEAELDGTKNPSSSGFEANIDAFSWIDGGNASPNANFSSSVASLTATFTDTSTDGDGTIVGWSWVFGDGGTSTAQNPSHSYAAAGTYTVTLTVTDDEDATDSISSNVTVTAEMDDGLVDEGLITPTNQPAPPADDEGGGGGCFVGTAEGNLR